MRVKNFVPCVINLVIFLSAANQISAQAPVASQAVNFKVSVPVRDLKVMNVTGKGVQIDQEEINEKNRAPIRTIDLNAKSTPDAALSAATQGNRPITPNPPNPPTVNFEGISIAQTIAVGQGFLPPDVNGEVGPNHYVQTVNSCFRVWDKAGVALTAVTPFSTLFAPLPYPASALNDGDPIVLYDQLADRWIISEFVTLANPNNHQIIAVSKTGDPTGAYYLYDFMMPNNKFNDYPKFGMWPDAYYMTDNQFNQSGTAFLGAGVFAFNRAKMLVGDPTASFIYFDVFTIDPNIGGMLPSDLDGFTPPVAGTPNTFAYFTANEFGDPSDGIRLFDFHADFAVPANSTFTERTGSPLVVAAFDPIPVPNSRNVVKQPAPATPSSYLDAIGDRLMFRLAYRNFGSSESLILNHTVNAAINPAYRAGVRFYQLNRATPAAAFTIAEQQTFAPAGTENRWMGSGAINHQADIAVGYSVSSATVFPSIRYAAKLGTDPAGSGLFQGEQSIVAGAGSQTSTSGRWGDYTDMTVDPSDDCTFWYTGEYYPVSSEPGNSTAPWHTRIAKFSPGTCTSSPRGTINGTITNCLTGLPIPLAFVSISGGFSRATLANGTYSATVPPGTYNVSATAPGYDVASATGLIVTNGGTVTFNACLNGNLKQPVADIGTVTADDCNSNGAIDPNENITVSLGIKNTGTLNTVNLVATLQATGGVISPGGPQNYGVVVAGGATVFRSFTFTAGNITCGSTVIATLQLQDGATNLGTISYNFVTGTIVVNNYSTGNISVAIPDNNPTGVDIPITVADILTLTDVNVSFRINHTFDGDLRISLVHPDNTIVPLVTNRGGSGANFGTGANDCSGTPTFIDDQATTLISAGTAPFAGSFRPESPLSALNGKPSNGIWKLRVIDGAAIDVGTVYCFKLELNKRVVCCGAQIVAAPPPVITAESCIPANNAVDPGETVTVNLCVQNVGGTNTTNLVGTLQNTGGVTAASGPQNYGVVVGSGPSVCRPFTFTATGACGSTITATINLQDGARNLGTVTFTMQLGTTTPMTQTFSNPAVITIPATGTGATTGAPATPYPSNITVSGVTGPVTKVTVNLKGLNHTFPGDVDMLLVSPTGQKFIILSDVIGGTDWVNINYTLDDAAASLIPNAGAPVSGTFKPTNYGTGDLFPAPAPAGPFQDPATAGTATFASVFNGLNPNGTWSLYVVDDAVSDAGSMAGWDLSITTAIPTCCSGPTCTVTCPANITVPNNLNQCGAVVNYPAPTTSGTCGTVTASPASGSFFPVGTTTVTATSSIGGGTCTFTITVNDAQAPTITCPANITVSNNPNQCGAVVNYPAPTVSDNCPGVTFVSSPASGSFFPVGTTTVTATATDASGNTATCTFTVTVNDTQPPTITCPANIAVCGSQVVNYPLPTVTDNCGLPGPIALTQTASQTPVAGSVACNSGGFHTLNSYWRAYNLAPLALPGPVSITSVQFGIELADANGVGTTQPMTVNVYTSAGAFPGAVRTLVGTSGVIQVPDQTLTTFTANLTAPTAPLPANSVLVLELQTPDGRAPANNRFFIGSNTSAQTGPSYILAVDCGIPTPTDLASIGFPNMHIILNANGVVTGPAPLVQIAGLPSGSVFPLGTTTNTFRATDVAGNTSTCSFNVTVTAPSTATILYAGSPYCSNAGTAIVTRTGTGGGSYSSTAGLTLNAVTGDVTLGTSTPGTYTVTYTIAAAGGCPAVTATTTITITALPAATISYAGSPYCSNTGTATVTRTGTAGGTYSSTAGLTLNAATGDVTLGTSTPGTYTVTYTIAAAGGCPAVTTTTTITITALPAATISYAGSPYCQNAGTATVTRTGTAGGTYSSAAGLTLNAATGTVTLGTSTPGTYTVTYTIAAGGGCPAVTATAAITITATPAATISYAGSPYCSNDLTAPVTRTGTAGGTYTSTAGLTINAATGTVTPNTSTPSTYTVTYFIAAGGGCAAFSTTTTITITQAPNAIIFYLGTPYCSNAGTANVSRFGTAGGTYSAAPAGLTINAATGAVTLGTSTAGTYTVTYTIAASGGCGVTITTTTITITAAPAATISYTGTPYCSNAGTANVTFTGTLGGTYTSTPGLTINAATGAVTLGTSTPGTYTVTYTVAASGGCAIYTTTTTITITQLPAATISYAGSPYCQNAGTATVTRTGTAGGTYSSAAGLSLNAATGDVNLAASTAGTYTVTYTLAAGGGCPVVTATTTITITTLPAATISYAGNPYCQNAGTANVTRTGTAGGTYSAAPAGLTINAATGAVTLATSTPGTYTVTYTLAAGGGCPAVTATTSITVNSLSTDPTGAIASSTTLCGPGTVTLSVTGGSLGAGATWKWYSGSCVGTLVGTGATLNVTVSTTTTYFVRAEGTCNTTICASVTVTVNVQPTITLTATSPTSLFPFQTSTLTATVTPATGNTIVWYRNGNVVSGVTGTSLTVGVDALGLYTVRATTGAGCTALSNAVLIKDTANSRMFINPNPNKGQFKVRFYAGNLQQLGFNRRLLLFAENGQKVFDNPYPITGPWSSMDVNATMLPKGTYFVMLADAFGNEVLATGKVVIQ